MKKKITYMLIFTGITCYGFSQTTAKRTVSEFRTLEVSGGAHVKLFQSDSLSLTVEADDRDQKHIVTEMNGDRLIIKTEGNIDEDYKITLNYKTIQMIDASGSAHVSTGNTLNGTDLEVVTSGASRALLDVVLKNLKSNVSGASTLSVSGATENHTSEVSGAAALKAAKLSSLSTDLNTSGASSAKVNANKKLNITAGGASSVKYYGTPEEKNITAGKASSIDQISMTDEDVKLNDIDTTKIKFGKRKYIIIDDGEDEKKKKSHTRNLDHWAGLELGINGYTGADNNVSLPLKDDYMSVEYGIHSLICNLNMFEKDFHIYKNYINLVTGIGFSFNSYQLKNKVILDPDSTYTYFKAANPNASFTKNKLKAAYIQMPLMLEFNSSNSRSKTLHLAAGVLAGYKLTSKTKQEFTLDGYEYYVTRKDDYNLNPFKLDATARIGYGDFTMFATYSLTTLFEKNKGPELYPFSVGVRIVPF